MKTVLAYILTLYISFSAVMPCRIIDNCEEEEQTEKTSDSNQNDDCSNCSPFSICSSGSGFILNALGIVLEPADLQNRPVYGEYIFNSRSEYHSRPFQPPKEN